MAVGRLAQTKRRSLLLRHLRRHRRSHASAAHAGALQPRRQRPACRRSSAVVGVARSGMTERRVSRQPDERPARVRDPTGRRRRSRKRLLGCVTCIEADPDDPASFDAHEQAARRAREAARTPAATACSIWRRRPTRSLPISRELGRAGLLAENGAWRRVVIEKPFGTDLASAQGAERESAQARRRAPDLPDRSLSRQGDGPEHPGAALRQRHVRADLEPQPHRPCADHRRRDSSASGGAAASTTQTGALRDMVPNHLFQLLSLIAMEPPIRFDADSVRAEKAEVLDAIQTQSEAEALRNSVRGQYRPASIGDERDRRTIARRRRRARTAPPRPMSR